MARSSAVRAPSRNAAEIARRFRVLEGGLGIVEQRAIDLLGLRAILVVERVAPGQLRASVAVFAGRTYASVWTLGRELADEAHRIAREDLEARGARPTSEGAWGTCWTVDAMEPAS